MFARPRATTVFPVARGVNKRQVGQWKWLTWPQTKRAMYVYSFYDYYSHTHFHTFTHNNHFFQSTHSTGWTGLLQLSYGIGICGGFVDCFHWQFPYICLYQFHPESGRLFPEKFSLSEVCTHNLDRREWRKMSQPDSMGLTDPNLPIICPFCLYRGCGFPFLASSWVTSCHLPLGFPFSATNCVFHCRASAACLLGLLYLLTWWCGISLFHRFCFYHFFVFGCCVFCSTNLTDKNGSRKLPFSASNFDSQCRLRRHPWCLISLFHMAVYHHLTIAGCDLNLANLIAKNGSWNLPFSASNCDIRGYIWLYFCLASGLSPLDRGFYHICNHLSVDCGGSIPPSEFWSWISSTLTLDGFYCPLRSSNGMLECILSFLTCHVVDLPSELLCLFARKLSAILCMACSWLVFLTCILLIDACLCATCVREFDDSTSESPLHLLTICIHSTFSLGACHLFAPAVS